MLYLVDSSNYINSGKHKSSAMMNCAKKLGAFPNLELSINRKCDYHQLSILIDARNEILMLTYDNRNVVNRN